MDNRNTPKHKNIFISCSFILNVFVYSFFIFNLFVYSVQPESNLRIDAGCCYEPNQTEIEFLLPERPAYRSSFYNLNNSPKQITDFTLATLDASALKYSFIHYNNYVRHQLKSFLRTSISPQQFVAILQKNNIWHQSSDEDSPLFS